MFSIAVTHEERRSIGNFSSAQAETVPYIFLPKTPIKMNDGDTLGMSER